MPCLVTMLLGCQYRMLTGACDRGQFTSVLNLQDEDALAMQCDRASRVVVRALLAVTVSMDAIMADPEQAGRLKMTFPSTYAQKIYCYEPPTGSTFRPGDTAVFKWLTKEGEVCDHVELKLYKGIPSGSQRYGRLQFVQIVASKTANTGSFSWTIPADVEACGYAKVTVSDFVRGDRFEDQSHSFSIITEAPVPEAGRIPSGAPPAYTPDGTDAGGSDSGSTGTSSDEPSRTTSGADEALLRRMLEKLEAPVETGSSTRDSPPPPATSGPNVTAPLEGKRVVIAGMQARQELNGQLGTAVSFSFERGRYTVQLGDLGDDAATIVAVRAHNVLPAPDPGVVAGVGVAAGVAPAAARSGSVAPAGPDGTGLPMSAGKCTLSDELRRWLEAHGSTAGPESGGAFAIVRLHASLVALGVEVPRDVLDVDGDDIATARQLGAIKVLEAKRLTRQLGVLQRAAPPPVPPATSPATPACLCAHHGSAAAPTASTSAPVAAADEGEEDDADDIYG